MWTVPSKPTADEEDQLWEGAGLNHSTPETVEALGVPVRGPRPLKLSLEAKQFRAREVTALLSIEQASCVIVTDDPFPATGQHCWKLSRFCEQPNLMSPTDSGISGRVLDGSTWLIGG